MQEKMRHNDLARNGGKTNLDILLQTMQPVLTDGVYVFHSSNITLGETAALNPILIFREEEGTTLILLKETADKHGLDYHYPARMITLNVHSSLDAVGFLAAITHKLAAGGISVNPVSAHFHDHLFVPEDKAQHAIDILATFSFPEHESASPSPSTT
jgi:hypothetical protein